MCYESSVLTNEYEIYVLVSCSNILQAGDTKTNDTGEGKWDGPSKVAVQYRMGVKKISRMCQEHT